MSSKGGQDEPISYEEEEARVKDLRTVLGPLSGRALQYANDGCLRRYLRARNWNVKKAEKMLRDSFAWRATYKPEELRWEDVATESETGKVYRADCKDKQGHSVLQLRPGTQNTTSSDGQIKQLVYMIENAVLNLPDGQEQMIWLVNFKGWSMSKAGPVRTVQEIAHVLQNHYPERLGTAILFDPPRLFETFWLIVKPFLDTKTAKKVKFVRSTDPASMKLVNDLFDCSTLEELLREDHFNLEEVSKQMCRDDAKFGLRRKLADERQERA